MSFGCRNNNNGWHSLLQIEKMKIRLGSFKSRVAHLLSALIRVGVVALRDREAFGAGLRGQGRQLFWSIIEPVYDIQGIEERGLQIWTYEW